MNRALAFILLFPVIGSWAAAGTVPANPSSTQQTHEEIPSPKELLNFLSLLIPDLNLPEAEPMRKELLTLIEKDPKLAQRIAAMRKKHYDSQTGILNAEGDLLAKQIAKSIQEGQKPKSALQLLSQIAKTSPFLIDRQGSGETDRFEAGKYFTGAEAPRIGKIQIETVDVFDPGIPEENWWLFRVANFIHIKTREEVVAREMLLKKGGKLDALSLLESERNIRALRFIKKAEILPVPAAEPGKLDLKVRTQDTWTTNINIGVGAEGGETNYSIGASEGNLLGRGKTVAFDLAKTGSVLQKEFLYRDPSLWGSRMKLIGLIADTSQGQQKGLDLYKPFYSLRNPYSYSLTHIVENFVVNRYGTGGGVDSTFDQDHRFQKANYSLKADQKDDEAQRLHFNYLFQEDRFTPTKDTVPGTLPKDRKLSGPTVGYSWTQARYLKEEGINKMGRTEDFNLGHELSVEAGVLPTALGSDKNRAIFNVAERKGLSWGSGFFAIGQAGAQSRVLAGKLENGLFYGNLSLFKKIPAEKFSQTLALHLEGAYGANLDGENQMRLGGETGLRGYKNNSFTGNKSVLANLEYRASHPKEFFRLFYVGAGAFFDVGAAAPEGKSLEFGDVKSDVGVDVRFVPSRSSGGKIGRLYVAYALNSNPGQPRYVVGLVAGQAFDFATNSIKRLLGDSATNLREEDSEVRHRKRKR